MSKLTTCLQSLPSSRPRMSGNQVDVTVYSVYIIWVDLDYAISCHIFSLISLILCLTDTSKPFSNSQSTLKSTAKPVARSPSTPTQQTSKPPAAQTKPLGRGKHSSMIFPEDGLIVSTYPHPALTTFQLIQSGIWLKYKNATVAQRARSVNASSDISPSLLCVSVKPSSPDVCLHHVGDCGSHHGCCLLVSVRSNPNAFVSVLPLFLFWYIIIFILLYLFFIETLDHLVSLLF